MKMNLNLTKQTQYVFFTLPLTSHSNSSLREFYQDRVAIGATEANADISVTGLDAVLNDLNQKEIGLELILKMPMLTNQQPSEVLYAVGGQVMDMLGNEQSVD